MKIRVAAVLASLAVLAGVPYVVAHWQLYQRAASLTAPPGPAPTAARKLVTGAGQLRYVGIVTYNLPAFERACRCAPNVAVHYVRVGSPIDMTLPHIMIANGAIPLLELEPFDMPLDTVAVGGEDRWLTRYARAVARLHAPVLMSFGPEANGDWYSWGYRHAPAAVFVAAWRHTVAVFRHAGVTRAQWVWIMNRAYQHSGSLRALWPGHRWVSMVGIDAYFEHRRATFSYEFADTVARVRRITASPIMITETAGSPAIGKLRAVRLLLAGVHAYHLTGFVWFDVAQHGGISRRDWRLEGHPAAMAAFRGSVASVRKG